MRPYREHRSENSQLLPSIALICDILYDMPIDNYQAAAEKIAAFLKSLNTLGGMRLKYRITAGEGARDPQGLEARELYIELSGPDAPMVTQRGGELLRALEQVAAKIIHLEDHEHDKISFDANNFKALRAGELQMAAEQAVERVRRVGTPYSFQPMSSRERRMLHLALKAYDDLETASSGAGANRFVVLYRKGDAAVHPVVAEAPARGGFNRRR